MFVRLTTLLISSTFQSGLGQLLLSCRPCNGSSTYISKASMMQTRT